MPLPPIDLGVVAPLDAGSGIHSAVAAYSFQLLDLGLGRSCDYRGKSEDIFSMMNRMAKEFQAD